MMSDHGANPILFNNNKKKIGRKRSRTLPTPHPPHLYVRKHLNFALLPNPPHSRRNLSHI